MADQVTLKLKNPLKIGDELIIELVLREPTYGQMQIAEKKATPNEVVMSLVGQVSGYDPAFLKEMAFSDFKKAGDILSGFLSDGPETSEK